MFERLRTLLRESLGTSPSPDALAAHHRLLHPLTVAHGERRQKAGGRARRSSCRPSCAPAPPPRLVGTRTGARALARRCVATQTSSRRTRQSERRMLLSRRSGYRQDPIAAELARSVHDAGAVVLAGRSPADTLAPIPAVHRGTAPLPPERHLSASCEPSAREYGSELSRLVPELRRRAPELPRRPPASPKPSVTACSRRSSGCSARSRRSTPLLLVLDDLHWADRPSLLLLRHLARVAGEGRLLILGAYRATDASRAASPRCWQSFGAIGSSASSTSAVWTRRRLRSWWAADRSDTVARVRRGRCTRRPRATRCSSRRCSAICPRPARSAGTGAGELEQVGLPEGSQRSDLARLARLDGRRSSGSDRRGDRPRLRRRRARAGCPLDEESSCSAGPSARRSLIIE